MELFSFINTLLMTVSGQRLPGCPQSTEMEGERHQAVQTDMLSREQAGQPPRPQVQAWWEAATLVRTPGLVDPHHKRDKKSQQEPPDTKEPSLKKEG